MSALGQKRTLAKLLDHLVGAGEQPSRHANAERLGDLEVDKELELCRLLHGQFTRFGTLQYLVYKDSCTATQLIVIGSIGHQRASLQSFPRIRGQRQTTCDCQVCNN